MWAIWKLHKDVKLFSKIEIKDKNEDQLSERLMGVAADWFLNSSPEQCKMFQ
jgi:hypothetical protein